MAVWGDACAPLCRDACAPGGAVGGGTDKNATSCQEELADDDPARHVGISAAGNALRGESPPAIVEAAPRLEWAPLPVPRTALLLLILAAGPMGEVLR